MRPNYLYDKLDVHLLDSSELELLLLLSIIISSLPNILLTPITKPYLYSNINIWEGGRYLNICTVEPVGRL